MSLCEFFPIQSGRLRVGEKGDLLYFGHVDLRVSAQIIVERSRSTLLRPDDDEIEWFSHSMEGTRLDGLNAPCVGRLQQRRHIVLSNGTIGLVMRSETATAGISSVQACIDVEVGKGALFSVSREWVSVRDMSC